MKKFIAIFLMVTALALSFVSGSKVQSLTYHQHDKDPLSSLSTFYCDQYEGTVIFNRDGSATPYDARRVSLEQLKPLLLPIIEAGHAGAVHIPCAGPVPPEPFEDQGDTGQPGQNHIKLGGVGGWVSLR